MSELYDFDPYARLDNNVVEENINLTATQPTQYNFVVPRHAPFFTKDFEIVHTDSDYPLREGVDYHFTHEFKSATLGTAKPVYGSITFVRHDFTGNFKIKYRTIGGIWVNSQQTILEILSQKLINPRKILWEDVADIPTTFPPIDHNQHVDDLVGMSEVVRAIKSLGDSIEQSSGSDTDGSYVPQVTIPHIDNPEDSWTRIATFDSSAYPASDLVLGVSGAERYDTSETSYYNITVGVRGGNVSMSVSALTKFDGGCRFGYRTLPELGVVEVWLANVPHRGKLTLTSLSKDHLFTLIPSTVDQEPANINYVEIYSVGSGISEDSKKLGGVEASGYVRMDLFIDYMANIAAKLDELSGADTAQPQVRPASYFVSRVQFTFAISDMIADLRSIVEYMETGTTDIPDEVTYLPPQLTTPTGSPDYFISRPEFLSAITSIKDEFINALNTMVADGILDSKDSLLAYINPPPMANFPFPITTTEESTGSAAVNYVSIVEFNQIISEILYVLNEMVNALKNVQ